MRSVGPRSHSKRVQDLRTSLVVRQFKQRWQTIFQGTAYVTNSLILIQSKKQPVPGYSSACRPPKVLSKSEQRNEIAVSGGKVLNLRDPFLRVRFLIFLCSKRCGRRKLPGRRSPSRQPPPQRCQSALTGASTVK